MRKLFFIICLSAIITSCANQISVIQKESHYPVIVKVDRVNKKALWVNFPFVFEIKKNTVRKIVILYPAYLYRGNNYNEDLREQIEPLFSLKSGKLKETNSVDNNMRFLRLTPQKYIVYSMHKIDSSVEQQSYFANYIEEAINSKKDTIQIGSIQDLKTSSPSLLHSFIHGDSIIFKYRYKEVNHRLKKPVIIM